MDNTKNGKIVSRALLVGTALVSLTAVPVSEVQAASGTGAMSAILLTPITVSGTQVLHFGSMTATNAGTMLIDTTGARTPGGAVSAVAGGNLEQAGVLSISAATGVAIDLSMAATSFTVTDGGGNTMVVNNFNLRTNAGGTAETITLVASPTTVPLGATLNVGAAQVTGTYTGTYTVNANYQ